MRPGSTRPRGKGGASWSWGAVDTMEPVCAHDGYPATVLRVRQAEGPAAIGPKPVVAIPSFFPLMWGMGVSWACEFSGTVNGQECTKLLSCA
eukprot:scaffold36143_cov31-Tisochrysis_lutea.AAC.4